MRIQEEPMCLADAMALNVSGPAIVFLRPRHPLSREAMEAFASEIKRARLGGDFASLAQVTFVVIPAHFDIMAAGDSELKRLGLVRIQPPEPT